MLSSVLHRLGRHEHDQKVLQVLWVNLRIGLGEEECLKLLYQGLLLLILVCLTIWHVFNKL